MIAPLPFLPITAPATAPPTPPIMAPFAALLMPFFSCWASSASLFEASVLPASAAVVPDASGSLASVVAGVVLTAGSGSKTGLGDAGDCIGVFL